MSNEAFYSTGPVFDVYKAPEMKLIGYMDVVNKSENSPEELNNTIE